MLNWFARKLKEVQEKDKTGQGGFTLIELLVVVIIIGILAAIAIPTFLSQRTNAQDRATQANLQSAATAQQSFYTENNRYGGTGATAAADLAALRGLGYPGTAANPQPTIRTATATAFCMDANSASTASFRVSNASGAPEPGAC